MASGMISRVSDDPVILRRSVPYLLYHISLRGGIKVHQHDLLESLAYPSPKEKAQAGSNLGNMVQNKYLANAKRAGQGARVLTITEKGWQRLEGFSKDGTLALTLQRLGEEYLPNSTLTLTPVSPTPTPTPTPSPSPQTQVELSLSTEANSVMDGIASILERDKRHNEEMERLLILAGESLHKAGMLDSAIKRLKIKIGMKDV